MAKLPVLSWIGNAAAVLFGRHGEVTQQAQEAGCSRQAAYDHAAKVQQAVAEAQLPGPRRADLLQENQLLRQENHQLRQQLKQAQRRAKHTICLDQAKRQHLAVLTWAMGLSLNQIVAIFAVLLADAKPAKVPNRATIGRWVLAFARRAGKVLEVLDEQARAVVRLLCLDELFFRRKPVLMAVEPASMAWLLGQRAKDRKGDTWYEAIEPFDHLEFVQSDQGTGLQAALRRLAKARQQAADAAKAGPQAADAAKRGPPAADTACADQPAADGAPAGPPAAPTAGADAPLKPLLCYGLDIFHIAQAAQPPLAAHWRRVERSWAAAEKAEEALAKAQAKGQTRKIGGLSRRVQAAREKLQGYWDWYERVETAWQRAKAALELFRPDGSLNDRVWASQEIQAACRGLKGPAWKKVRTLLNDPRTLAFLDRAHQQLAEVEKRPSLREALVRLWRLQKRPDTAGCPAAVVVARLVCARLAPDWQTAYQRVHGVLSQVLRASSAVECVNSIVRMQQARHRNLSQPMLDLKRLYWNCRPFRRGKRRGKCPYQHLGVALPTYDFWELLQRDPDQLRQELSSQQLRA
jgi:hypothetical protein